MGFAPIVERELRLLSRRTFTYRIRAMTALAATLIGFGVAFASVSMGSTAAVLGRNLFTSITLLAFVACVMAGPVLAADCLSEEKRNGTLGLLFLAGLKGREVVAGKLTALTLPAVYCLAAVIPIMGFSFLLGGVTGGEFARVALVLMEALLFSLAAAMAISAVSREGTRALGGSAILVLFVILGLPGLAGIWAPTKSAMSPPALPSPLLGLQYAETEVYAGSASKFWMSAGGNFLLSCGLLTVASLVVPRSWRDKPAGSPHRAAVAWPFARNRKKPDLTLRRRLLLEDEPLVWAATRQRASSFAAWSLVAAAGVVFLFGHAGQGQSGFRAGWIFIVFYCLHVALKILIAWDASRRFASDRESGALELLLCCPLEECSIWRSWLIGLKRTYLLPMLTLGFAEVVIFLAGMDEAGWWQDEGVWGAAFAAGLVLLITDTYAVSWMGIWQGVSSRNSTRACLNSMGLVLFAPGAVTIALFGLAGLLGGPSNIPFGTLLMAWFVLGLATDLAACGYVMLKLNEEFRAVIAHAAGSGGTPRNWRARRRAGNRPAARLRLAKLQSARW